MVVSLIVLFFLLAGCHTMESQGQEAPGHLVMERTMLPVRFSNPDGSSYTVDLDAIIVRPDDDKPHPLAVINHGYDPRDYAVRYIDDFRLQTIEFARRGWTAIAFSRRGYGHSGGKFSEKIRGCAEDKVVEAGVVPTDDILAVIHLMDKKSYVDASKIIAVGHSGGGYAMIALAAKSPPGLMAAINIAGAINATTADSQFCYSSILTKVAARAGRNAKVPMLWMYAENDAESPAALGRRMYAAYTHGGGDAEFVSGIWYGTDGHNLFYRPESISVWTPYVDAFLQKHGLKLMDGLISTSNLRLIDDRK